MADKQVSGLRRAAAATAAQAGVRSLMYYWTTPEYENEDE
jgi:hypothetical protein